MSVHKRGNNWYVNFWFNRIRYRRRSPDNTRSGAEAFEALMRQKLARGESLTPTKPTNSIPSFSEFTQEWLAKYVESNNKYSEIKTKHSILSSNLLPYFGNMKLNEITNQRVEEYKMAKMRQGLKSKTINNHLSCLRKSLNTAVEWGLLEHTPKIKMLRVPPPTTDFLTREECSTVLNLVEGNMRDMILFVLHTGVRFGELSGLMWQDVDFEERIVTIQRSITMGVMGSTKSNKIRKIPLTDDVYHMLRTKIRDGKYVFTEKDGKPVSQSTYTKRLLWLSTHTNAKKVTWHKLRHTFASHLANSPGVEIQTIQVLLGHADLKTTMRYAHIAKQTLVDAVNVLPKHVTSDVWTQGGHKEVKLEMSEIRFPAK